MEIVVILIAIAVFIALICFVSGYSSLCPKCKSKWALREVDKQQQLGSPDGIYVVLYSCKRCNYQEMKVEDRRSPD